MSAEGRQVCLVTGASNGIGLAAAQALAGQGWHVIMAGRNRRLTEDAAGQVRRAIPSAYVEIAIADLSIQDDVHRLADHVLTRHPRLDVLINNAGTIRPRPERTSDGTEVTWAVNFLAPFLLTSLLLDLLRRSAPARIVNVASHGHLRGVVDFDDVQFERRPFSMRAAYAQSKLALVMFTIELAHRLEGSGVMANSVHPGFIGSNLGAQVGGRAAMVWRLMRPFLTSSLKGAETVVYLATSPEVADVTGMYFVDRRSVDHNPLADDADARGRLWELASAMTTDRTSIERDPD